MNRYKEVFFVLDIIRIGNFDCHKTPKKWL